jgi:predicted permease
VRVASAIHRAALRLYPAQWRARMGDDYHATALARWRAAAARGQTVWLALVLFTVADTCASGLAARLETLRAVGAVRPSHWSSLMTRFLRHLRQGARSLRHARTFTLMASLTLTVGIGAAAAAFTALDAAVLTPLPYATGTRLVVLAETRLGREISVSYPDYLDWREEAAAFDALAAFRGRTVTLTGAGGAERAAAQAVTSDLFAVLATQPALGRPFGPDDDRRGAPRHVILGHALWQQRFGGSRSALGQSIQIDGEDWEITGIMPKGFAFPDGLVYGPADLYLSMGGTWVSDLENRDSHPGLVAIGLLKPEVTLVRVRQEMDAIARGLSERYPDSNRETGVVVTDGVTALIGDLRVRLTGVTAAAVLLLVIACANVAGLTLTRAISRRREFLVRLALGESQGSLASALLAEHVILGALGASGGLALAYWLTGAAAPLLTRLPRLDGLTPDASAFAFVTLVLIGTTVALGSAPLLWLRRAHPGALGQRGQSGQGIRVRHALVGAQVALAVVLLATALLFASSFWKLASAPGGIEPDGTLSFQIALPNSSYTPARRVAFFETLLERLATNPSVTEVGGITTLPFTGAGAQAGITLASDPHGEPVSVDVAAVAGEYFRAMGVPVLQGRAFGPADDSGAPVAIVDERFAERFWPGQDPIGRRLSGYGFMELEVVGVVGHVKNYGAGAISREELFVPYAQRPTGRLYPIVRTTGDPLALVPAARRIVGELDPTVVVALPRAMTQLVDRTLAGPRLAATLTGVFGGVAVLLAAVGIYSVVSYSVALRRRESAIRMALGAPAAHVVRAQISGIAIAIAAGGAAGLAASLVAGRWIESQLFSVSPGDPALLALTGAAIAVVGLVAAWLPARRAARTPAALVLQEEG